MKKFTTYYSIVLLILLSITSCSTDDQNVISCPELSFEASLDNDVYFFHPVSFDGIDDVIIEWSIDGEFIENVPGNDSFSFQFQPGTYEVCMAVETPECPEGVSFCETIIVEEPAAICPELAFEAALDNDEYFFHPVSFDGIDDLTIDWSIDGEFIENVPGNDSFSFQFEPGTYEVCMAVETPECPEGAIYCDTITVN